ncbi:unnamed protein product [Bursaphelenchus xylophilus]|uniref:(pine wood nematode) hypothetical protein n=1 Tax=Bursaphelenchus xylophilus TaxID=6326 RepID=A0A1I7RLS5_BURXY|nr:unnamed protein product [Bursaphelenchus xylophilus]CAG9106306.1 unnamed protein product [Bursaphelenchus xylophilus]
MQRAVLALLLGCQLAAAQIDAFAGSNHYAAKPTITPDIQKYFELDGHARELVDTLIGPRPGGFFPEKTYEVARPAYGGGPAGPQDGLAQIGNAISNFFNGPPAPQGAGDLQLPPGFNQGFSLNNGGKQALSSFQENGRIAHAPVEQQAAEVQRSPSKSSISGIPSDYPKLPKFPFSSNFDPNGASPSVLKAAPELPKFASRPEVPEGGFGAMSDVRRYPSSVSEAAQKPYSSSATNGEYSEDTLTDEPRQAGGLIGTIMDLFAMSKDKENPPDMGNIAKGVGNLLTGQNSPLPGKNIVNNVLYKALTQNSIDSNSSSLPKFDFDSSTPITLNEAQQKAIAENLEMVEGLIIQPSSPLCNPKPEPITEMNIDAFMGTWYQVVYSPPLSSTPCSMVTYKKMSDVNPQNGGIGSLFEVFEYKTGGAPYSKPTITSGFAILKEIGELIFRTTANKEDVTVYIIHNGPINQNGQYEYVVMSTNCNYPLYVFARDPILYRQKYEKQVLTYLEKRGIINGFSKLFNTVAPVDASTCTFPPNLFNSQV